MPLRMEDQEQHRRKEAEPGTRQQLQQQQQQQHPGKASSLPASQDAQPVIIECRKKNSKQESVVTHRFRKGRLLGKGGFAHCYKVTCVETARPYAMKIVPKSTLVKSRARQKLQTEIKIHRTLQHPRVVRFEMFFEDRENVYILLELCANHLIRKTKRFTEDEARRYMLQILEATSYLHQHQIIHRDLKLGNVFLDRDWNIKMGDFGLATKLAQDSERKRTICGTPNYIAPEILEGKAGHSYQVDLWSAGVILYTMLVGRPPYESTDVKSTYRRILANVYTFPDSVPVSDSAKDLVGRLLQVKPELRPSLDDILNHPFLRNGGPRQRFSTSHGLRGSSASSSPPSSAVASSGGGGGSSSTASRLGSQKHGGTPERCAASGGFGRPPLKTRSSNVEAETAEGGGGGVTATAEGAARLAKARPGTPTPIGKAGGDGGREATGGLHASKRTTACPTSSRSIVPRTHNTKGFSVYCDTKEAAGSRERGAGANDGGAQSSGSRRVASTAGGGGRRSAAASAGGAEAAVKSPGGDKENDPRSAIGGGGTGGVRVPVNGPISRRPVVRSASSVGSSGRASGRDRAEGNSTGGGGAKGLAAGGNRKPSIRRSASAVGTHADHRRVASAREAGGEYGSRGKKAAAGAAAAGAVTPRVRSSAASRGTAVGSPPTPSPYRSSPLPGPASGGGGSRMSTRMVAVGGGTTPRSQAKSRGDARQRLDFGSTPRSTRQRGSPAATAAGPFAAGPAAGAAGGSAPSRSGAARGTRASAAAAAAREAAMAAAAPPPPAPTVWVTRYVDYSTKYGLGFLLSDGSAGVYFNDATKIVLEPDGVAFEYIERTRRSTSSSSASGGTGDQPPRARHTLEDFPPELQKKVTLLNHFRGYLHELVKKGRDGGAGGSSCEGNEEEAVSAQGEGGKPLTFLRKWLRTRNAILFRLSNRTVQVVFADHTEILLSNEARVVTFVDKHGSRETHSLQGVLQDQSRSDITKRVRYSNELIAQLLRRA
ncbi:unnamed protein product [Ectocarpus sp. 13 AM-2016]